MHQETRRGNRVKPKGNDTSRRRSASSLIFLSGLALIAAASAVRANEPDFSPPLPPIAFQSPVSEPQTQLAAHASGH